MDLHRQQSQQQHKTKEQEQQVLRRYRSGNILDNYRGRCTFCGSAVDAGERFCTECGNNLAGIKCPHCGTLNYRSFCSNCFAPLNEMAEQALSDARWDPHFQRAEQLAAEMAELEKIIDAAKSEVCQYDDAPDQSVSLSDADRKVLSEYNDLFAGLTNIPATPAGTPSPNTQSKAKERKKFAIQKAQDAIAAYRAKAAELQMHIDAMTPPTAATPEEKRNFFSARMIRTTRLEKVAQEWVCNFCGCHHKCPNECAEPQLGGKWIFEDKLVETTQYIID